MKIISHVLLGLQVYDDVPERIKEQWAEGLKNNAARFHAKRQQIIPSQEAFINSAAVAVPSRQGGTGRLTADYSWL